MDYGMKVNMKMSDIYNEERQTLRNVTRIAYYPTRKGSKWLKGSSKRGSKVAFESDIHETGITFYTNEIELLDIVTEDEVAIDFCEDV